MKEDHQETPRTAAGRDLLSVLAPDTVADNSPSWTLAILAIEAEAAARQVTASEERIRELEKVLRELVETGEESWPADRPILVVARALLSAGDKAEAPPTVIVKNLGPGARAVSTFGVPNAGNKAEASRWNPETDMDDPTRYDGTDQA